ncbi:MAG: alpha-amylase, partial [Gammaproteobacteria bacterium]|nr:alpha-amylase [Gammaproteobacteria bacterium]NNL49340.1 alpha-amylase [Woeseiaceae bacterium]
MRASLAVASLLFAALFTGCGGGGGSAATPSLPTPDPATTVTVYYLRVTPEYDGWGLHLWGDAIAANVTTTWSSPRLPNRVENGAAVFEVPVTNEAGNLNFIAHNGDLKSPIHDLGIVPRDFGNEVWIVQDEVASANGIIGTPFASESAALAALSALGDKSAGLDLAPVVVNDVDLGLPAAWVDSAAFIEIYVRGYQDSDGDGIGDFQGLISRLDYLESLGVTGIWLMPITESADNDHGYAVEDYRAVETDFGSMTDFELLLAEAHARDIAIIID